MFEGILLIFRAVNRFIGKVVVDLRMGIEKQKAKIEYNYSEQKNITIKNGTTKKKIKLRTIIKNYENYFMKEKLCTSRSIARKLIIEAYNKNGLEGIREKLFNLLILGEDE